MWIRAALILSLALPASAFLPPVVTPSRSVRCNVGKKGSDEIAPFDKERADSLMSRLGDAAKETKAAPAPAPAPKAASAPKATPAPKAAPTPKAAPAPKAAVAPAPKAVAASSGTSAGTSSPTTVAGGLFVLAAGGLIAWRKERMDGDGGDLLAGLMGGGGGGVAVVGKGIEPAAVSTKATAEWKREQALSPAELAKSTAQWKREQAPANPGLFSQGKAKAAAVAKLSAEILEKKKAAPPPKPAPAPKPAPTLKPAPVVPKPAPAAPKPAPAAPAAAGGAFDTWTKEEPATAPAAAAVESPVDLTKSTAQWKRDEQGGALAKNWPRTTAVLRALRLMRR